MVSTTIQLDEKQVKTLMHEKIRYGVPYRKIVEGYHTLISKLSLREELDVIMEDIKKRKKETKDKETKDKETKGSKKK
jgi:ABC-type lipopolysaccharide export system ATPase subunit